MRVGDAGRAIGYGKLLAAALLLVTLALGLAACGGGEKGIPATTATPGKVTPVAPTPTTAPAGTISLQIASVGDELKFDKGKLTVSAGSSVRLRFDNKATAQQHNWVLVQAGTELAVADAGAAAGPANGWLPRGDARVIANSVLLDPAKSGEVTFTAPPPGTYGFLCSFPAHAASGMVGVFEVK